MSGIGLSRAIRKARGESCMYRQGRGWIVSIWREELGARSLSQELSYGIARQMLADWRAARVQELRKGKEED